MSKTTVTGGFNHLEDEALQQDFRLLRRCQYCQQPPQRNPLIAMGNGNHRHAGCKPPVTPQIAPLR